jgi:hypothetical protein
VLQENDHWTNLVRLGYFHGNNENMVEPKQTTFDGECLFLLLVLEEFPSAGG